METGMFIVSLLVPLAMIIWGAILRNKHWGEDSPNYLTGIRTRRSMQNRKTWAFAQKYGGLLMLVFGLVLLPASLVAMILAIRHGFMGIEAFGFIVFMVQMFFMIIIVVLTEAALKKNFDNEGLPRDGDCNT